MDAKTNKIEIMETVVQKVKTNQQNLVGRFKKFKLEQEKKEKIKDLKVRKEVCLYNLFDSISTEDSIEVFKAISLEYEAKMEKRLKNIINEQDSIQKWKNHI
jgi:hypothetical protein